MPIEKSAGAVIFRKEPRTRTSSVRDKGSIIYYLLLHYESGLARNASATASKMSAGAGGHWDFPKGHIEKGENIIQTVRREVEEETGIKDIKIISGFKEWIKYFFRVEDKNIFKIVTFFMAETKTKEVKISFEHKGFKWLPYEEALEQLNFKNAKEILKKANGYLAQKFDKNIEI